MIKYYNLFSLLAQRGMKKTDLLQIISSGTLAKLSKGENVQTDIIDKICLFLECQPNDIMRVVSNVSEKENSASYTYKTITRVDADGIPITNDEEFGSPHSEKAEIETSHIILNHKEP